VTGVQTCALPIFFNFTLLLMTFKVENIYELQMWFFV